VLVEPEADATTPVTSSGVLSTAEDLFTRADDDLQRWYAAGLGPPVPPPPRA
jgi:hypothetical protein